MDRFFARHRLSALIDGRLDPEEAAELRRALREDPVLAREHAELVRAVELLRRHGPAPAPPGFRARLARRLADEPPPAGRWGLLSRLGRRVPAEAVVALAAAAVVLVLLPPGGGGEAPAPADLAEAPGAKPALDAGTGEAPADDGGGNEVADAGAAGVEAADRGGEAGAPAASSEPPAAVAVPEAEPEADEAPARAAPPRRAAPGRPVRAREVRRTSTGAAGPAFRPAWEAEPEAGEVLPVVEVPTATAPRAWRMTIADRAALFRLSALATRLGGRLLDAGGEVLVPHEMNDEHSFYRVVLDVPEERADELSRQLAAWGASAVEGPAPAAGPGRVAASVEVLYAP